MRIHSRTFAGLTRPGTPSHEDLFGRVIASYKLRTARVERRSSLAFCFHLVKEGPVLCQGLSSANYPPKSNTAYEQLSQRSTSAQTSHIRPLHVHNQPHDHILKRNPCLLLMSVSSSVTFEPGSPYIPHLTRLLHSHDSPLSGHNNPLTPQTSQLPRRSSETQMLNSPFRFHRAHEHRATIRSLR